MKIAFIFVNFPSGGDTFTINKINALIERGHVVNIFALSPKVHLTKIHKSILENDLISKTIYFNIPTFFLFKLLLFIKSFLKSPIKSSFILIKIRKNVFNRSFGNILKNYFKYLTLKLYSDVDIIYFQNGMIALDMIYVKDLYPQIRVITNFLGYDFTGFIRRSKNLNLYKNVYSKSDRIICQSIYSRNIQMSLGCAESKIDLLPLTINFYDFNTSRTKYNKDIIVFTIVSRLVEKKGHNNLLVAFSFLTKKYSNIRLNIVGSGPLKEDIEYKIHVLGIYDKVTMHGFKTQDELSEIYSKTSIFVSPSITTLEECDQEDTTTTLLEAQYMGIPVIATYHAGIPEIVIDGVTGFLVQERNEYKLAEAMEQFILKPEIIETMGIAARNFIEINFNKNKLTDNLEKILFK